MHYLYPGEATPHRHRSVAGRAAYFAVGFAILLAIAFLLLRDLRGAKSESEPGALQATRIVVDQVQESKRGGQMTWRADYKIAYSVADREYTIWTDSGIRGDSDDDVRLILSSIHPSCRARYDPAKPEASVAVCQ